MHASMRYGLSVNMMFRNNIEFLQGKNWECIFSRLREYDIGDIEIFADKYPFAQSAIFKKYIGDLSSRRSEIKSISAHAGVSISGDSRVERRKLISAVQRELQSLAGLKPDLYVIHPEIRVEDFSRLDSYRTMLANCLGDLTGIAEKYHIRIAVENLRRRVELFPPVEYLGENIDNLTTVISGINHPLLGLCFDAGHGFISQPPLLGKIAACGAKLFHFHASDNFGVHDDHLLPGIGRINWRDVFSDLKRIRYTGVFLLEIVPNIRTLNDMGNNADFALIRAGQHYFEHLKGNSDAEEQNDKL